MKSGIWYCLNVKTGTETTALREIVRMNHIVDSFVPMKNDSKGRLRKAMPGYVFVKIDKTISGDELVTQFAMLKQLKQVRDFMGGKLPKEISDIEIARLKDNLEPKQVNVDSIDLSIGEDVKVFKGPFKGYNGKVVNVDNDKKKVRLKVYLFNRETELDIAFEDLSK